MKKGATDPMRLATGSGSPLEAAAELIKLSELGFEHCPDPFPIALCYQ
jgi:hypothetical protein